MRNINYYYKVQSILHKSDTKHGLPHAAGSTVTVPLNLQTCSITLIILVEHINTSSVYGIHKGLASIPQVWIMESGEETDAI